MKTREGNLWNYIDRLSQAVCMDGRKGTADNYLKAKRCLQRFHPGTDLCFSDVTEEFVQEFNTYLIDTGIRMATISFYNRVLQRCGITFPNRLQR